MNNPKISIIAAVGKNTHAIGKNNQLLWRIPEDLRRFKNLTSGHVVIIGEKTFNSIGRPLPNRTNIVISNNKKFIAEGCLVVHSFESALEKAKENVEQSEIRLGRKNQEIFIIGGGMVYRQALPLADKLYLTLVESDAEGDVFFPDYNEFTKKTLEQKNVFENLKYTFVELEK